MVTPSSSNVKTSSLNAIDSAATEPDYDRSFSIKSTSHNKVVDSSSYVSSTSVSNVSHNEVTHITPGTIHECENALSYQNTSLSTSVNMKDTSGNSTCVPLELMPITTQLVSLILNTVVSCNLPLYHGVDTSLNGLPLDIHILIDSGASENYISPKISDTKAGMHHHVHGREVETAGGNTSPITDRVVFSLNLQGHSSPVSAFVFDTKFDVILGRSWLKSHTPKANWLDDSWI
ncbi:hypothetical protein A0J61_10947, partial [Choanephora cucurbitarum]